MSSERVGVERALMQESRQMTAFLYRYAVTWSVDSLATIRSAGQTPRTRRDMPAMSASPATIIPQVSGSGTGSEKLPCTVLLRT